MFSFTNGCDYQLTKNKKACLPASIAFLAASLKWLTMVGISSVLRRLGGVNMASSMALERIWGINGLSVQEMGACPFGWKPLLETLPTCQIWQKMMPPLSWTASTIGFHAFTCSLVLFQVYLDTFKSKKPRKCESDQNHK